MLGGIGLLLFGFLILVSTIMVSLVFSPVITRMQPSINEAPRLLSFNIGYLAFLVVLVIFLFLIIRGRYG